MIHDTKGRAQEATKKENDHPETAHGSWLPTVNTGAMSGIEAAYQRADANNHSKTPTQTPGAALGEQKKEVCTSYFWMYVDSEL